MLATAGLIAWLVTQSTPATMPDIEPLPVQPSTFTATSWAALATPYSVPPMVPATWVPCPWQSSAMPSPVVLVPQVARPPNVVWVVLMPVSSTYACTVAAEVEYP
jgi:hypothetical protein